MNKLFELSEDSKTSLIEDIEEYKSVVEKNLLQRLWLIFHDKGMIDSVLIIEQLLKRIEDNGR